MFFKHVDTKQTQWKSSPWKLSEINFKALNSFWQCLNPVFPSYQLGKNTVNIAYFLESHPKWHFTDISLSLQGEDFHSKIPRTISRYFSYLFSPRSVSLPAYKNIVLLQTSLKQTLNINPLPPLNNKNIIKQLQFHCTILCPVPNSVGQIS